jgi:hypothetical protein
LPITVDAVPTSTAGQELPAALESLPPATLDTSHTDTYVPLPLKGVYVPKAEVEGFTVWLQALARAPHAEQSLQFLSWYRAANTDTQKEANHEANLSIQ